MKRLFQVPALCLTACLLFSSCLKNDESEVVLYDDAAITSFTLGTLTQTNPKTGATTTLTGSVYKMVIDQLNHCIYNRDSLPAGTAVTSVLATVSSKNSGGIAIRTLNDTTLLEWYSSSRPIDFSSPRLFRVYATDGSYYRDYDVQVNVKKNFTDEFWTAQGDTTLFGNYTKVHLLSLDTMLVALGTTASATQVCLSQDKGKTWTKQSQEFDTLAYHNAVVCGDSLFVLSANQLFATENLTEWSAQASNGVTQLVGASTRELFGLTEKHEMMRATIDQLDSWTKEHIDATLADSVAQRLLTLQDMSCISFPYSGLPATDYVLLVGNDGNKTVVWRKISQYQQDANSGQWVNIPAEYVNNYQLPKHSPLSLVYADSKVWAMGNGSTTVYQSTDQGISWRTNSDRALPLAMNSVTVDADGVLWAISLNEGKGKIWRGMSY